MDEPEPATWIGNRIGLWQINTQGQTFYNRFQDNDVGLRQDGVPPGETWTGAHDINSNNFAGNGIAVQWGLDVRKTEFNHNDFVGNDVAFRVYTAPETFVEGPQAYLHAAGCGEQFADIEIDGVAYQAGAFTTRC
jgi:hypothetical protein